LRYGLFTGCTKHTNAKLNKLEDNNLYPDKNSEIGSLSGVNSCFRCAPTSHWNNILKGYDTDEYLISTYQTKNLVYRNYNKGFTSLFIQEGKLMFDLDVVGRGNTINSKLKLWDEKFTASDNRSNYLGKKQN